jgi:glycosidase
MKDWLNQWPSYQNTSYRDQPLADPYASDIDKAITVRGWFTPFLVDLNQRNSFVQNFLIQYAIWATEEFGLDGWRVDTYFYNEPAFLNQINRALLTEFPSLTVFGEATAQTVLNSAYFVQNNYTNIPFKHNAAGVTDFPLQSALLEGLKHPDVNKVYNSLSQDFVYKDPTRNCIFLDNHDQDRFYSVIGEDFEMFKMGINWLLTLRGIPQLYYGTEILMKNFKAPTDAEVRKDFPGGWKEDPADKFFKTGRTALEEEAWVYISKLANFRKTSTALTKGKLMQYLPEGGLYAYFRYDPIQTVMVISYTGKENMSVKMNRFEQRTKGFTKLKNVLTGEVMNLNDFSIKPKQSFIFELTR